VNRTYHDAAEALAQYSSLNPRTELYSTSNYSATTPCLRIPSAYTYRSSIREWNLGASTAPYWHAPRNVSRRNIWLPRSDMGALCLPSRTAYRIRHTLAGYGLEAWTTCEHRRKNIPPVPGAMGEVLGCQYSMSFTGHRTAYFIADMIANNCAEIYALRFPSGTTRSLRKRTASTIEAAAATT
jgi:hypothetical protein